MALINCPSCGTEVDDKVEICFKCGCPLEMAKEDYLSEEPKEKQVITNSLDSGFSIGKWTFVIGIVTMIVGVIVGYSVQLSDFGYAMQDYYGSDNITWSFTFGIWVTSIITGTVLIALSEIIKILDKIEKK